MKYWLSAALVALSLAIPPAAAEETPAWAKGAVENLQKEGLLQGYPGGHLKGQQAMSRYELSELLNRVEARDQEQHGDYATEDSVTELQKSAESVRDGLDQLGGSGLEKRVDEMELRLDELGRPEL